MVKIATVWNERKKASGRMVGLVRGAGRTLPREGEWTVHFASSSMMVSL